MSTTKTDVPDTSPRARPQAHPLRAPNYRLLGGLHCVLGIVMCGVLLALAQWWFVPIDGALSGSEFDTEWRWMVAVALAYPAFHAAMGLAYAVGLWRQPMPLAAMGVGQIVNLPFGTLLGLYTLWCLYGPLDEPGSAAEHADTVQQT